MGNTYATLALDQFKNGKIDVIDERADDVFHILHIADGRGNGAKKILLQSGLGIFRRESQKKSFFNAPRHAFKVHRPRGCRVAAKSKPAVKISEERHHAAPFRTPLHAGEHCRFHGFASGIGEKDFLGKFSGSKSAKFLGQRHLVFIQDHISAVAGLISAQNAPDSFQDFRMVVADIGHSRATSKIQMRPSVEPYFGALGFGQKHARFPGRNGHEVVRLFHPATF